MKVMMIPIVVGALGTAPKSLGVGGTEDQRQKQDHQDQQEYFEEPWNSEEICWQNWCEKLGQIIKIMMIILIYLNVYVSIIG